MPSIDEDLLAETFAFFTERTDDLGRTGRNQWHLAKREDFPPVELDPIHHALGITQPMFTEGDLMYHTTICPALIVQAADGVIDPSEWEDYLSALWARLQLMIEMEGEEAAEAMVDSLMELEHPGLYAFYTRVRRRITP